MTSRREFLDRSLSLAVGAAALPALARAGTPRGAPQLGPAGIAAPAAARSLRILFLGGTGFIGPHMVRYAMYRGHKVSLFNRGRTAPDMFPGAETLIGDRDGKLDALKGRTWDAVIDNSGYVPRHVRDSATLLKDSVGRYLFTSTGSVYNFDQDYLDEDSEVLPIDDPASEDVNKYYGPLKVLCEQAVRDVYGHRGTIVRLHVVAGPGDPTDRFTYWPVRIDRGGEIVAPGDPAALVQFIDARDLAEFNIHALERDIGGTYNTAGPTLEGTTLAEFLYGIRAVTNAELAFRWVDADFLAQHQARYPLVYPQTGPLRGLSRVRSHRAVAQGLRFRPLAVTARETLDWFKEEPAERQAKLALNLERDARMLAAYAAKRAGS